MSNIMLLNDLGILQGVLVNKQDFQSIVSEFDSHWVPKTSCFDPLLNLVV